MAAKRMMSDEVERAYKITHRKERRLFFVFLSYFLGFLLV